MLWNAPSVFQNVDIRSTGWAERALQRGAERGHIVTGLFLMAPRAPC